MKGWIFNASPLILLGKIGQLHLIEVLSPDFRIPRPVVAEIGVGPPADRTIMWLTQSSISTHIVDASPTPPFLKADHIFELDHGRIVGQGSFAQACGTPAVYRTTHSPRDLPPGGSRARIRK